MSSGTYLFVLPVEAYPVAPGRFAIEGAFAAHLVLLRERLGPLGAKMVVMSPRMSLENYTRSRASLAELDEEVDGIRYRPAFEASVHTLTFARGLREMMRAVYDEVSEADIVHANASSIYRPFEFPALLMGRALGKKTISVCDIDRRNSAAMLHEAGLWSTSELVACRLIHDPWVHLQQLLAVRAFDLVLMKGRKLAEDYGAGRDNVKNFLDAAFTEEQVLSPAQLVDKTRNVIAADVLSVSYFGRLVEYKGVDHMLRAVAKAISLGARLHFHVIGDGGARPRLEALSADLGLGDVVEFHGTIPFGAELFAALRPHDVLLATPLGEDTPRSALDAMACGQAILAYDSYYYRDLAAEGGGVELVAWGDHEAMGTKLAELAADRPRIAALMERSRAFAHENTQEAWLDRRVAWTRALFIDGRRTLGTEDQREATDEATRARVSSSSASRSNGFSMQEFGTSSRNRWALGFIAPAVRNTIRAAWSGTWRTSSAWSSIPVISGIIRSEKTTSKRSPPNKSDSA